MKKAFSLLILLNQFIAQSQPKTKQVIVEGTGPVVVLLHGGTFDLTSYAAHAKLLADSFTVVRMLHFNVQFSDEGRPLPANYSVQMESEAVKETLASLHLTGPVVLVGHSYGGVIAFDLAMNHPDRVRSLVLIEAPLFDLARTKGQFSDKMKEIVELTKEFSSQAVITEEMIKAFRCEMTNCDTFDIRKHPMWPKWLKQKNRLRGLSAVPGYKIPLEEIHTFHKPVLIITGTATIEPHKTIDRLLALEFPRVKTASLPGEHTAVYQNPEIFVQLLREFLASISQPDTASRQFMELETQWMNAWKNKDESVMRKLLAEDFTLISSLSNGELVNKEMWIEKALQHYHCESFSIDKLTAKRYGQTAVLNIWFRQKATANGKDWSGDFLLTDIWVQDDAGWQVISRHASWIQKK